MICEACSSETAVPPRAVCTPSSAIPAGAADESLVLGLAATMILALAPNVNVPVSLKISPLGMVQVTFGATVTSVNWKLRDVGGVITQSVSLLMLNAPAELS